MSSTKTAATPSAGERASARSAVSTSSRPVGLSQQLGNQYLQVLLRARLMQAKLTVSHPEDVYEQEADRVAEHVMRMPAPVAPAGISAIQRRPANADERELRQSSGSESEVPTVDGATEHAIQSLSERGSALPGSVRAFMEPRFNADFSAVRVHNDAQAHELARAVNAQAFTVGRNVVFAAGRYTPETDSGKRLLAHELTHVVQQSAVAGPGRGPQSNESGTTIEQRSSAAERSDSLAIARAATPTLARAPDDWLKGTAPAPASTLDRWLSGPVWVRGLPYTEVTEAIDEIEQYLNRQTGSSAKSVRLEEALHLLRSELRRQDEAAEPRAKRRRGRRARANAASRPASRPRILTSKSSVAYASLAEVRAEYDLIMQWLAVPDLPAKDRRILRVERTNLEPQLQSGRERVMLERHSTRVRAALTASDGSDPGAALLSLARTIDGISKDPDNDAIAYLHYQHERIAISAEQAAGLRNDLAHTLEHTALRIFGDASLELDRYHKVVAQNDDQWLQARAAELFAGKLRGFDDPLGALQARFPRIGEDVAAIRRFVKAGRLADAAALLPRIEVLGREMAHVSRAFQKGYIEGAERAITVLEITAKAAAAIELSLLAVAAAPFVAGYVGGFVGAEGLGLTGIAGTAVTTVGTAAGTGTLVGGANVVLRGGETFAATLLTGRSLAEAWDASTEQAAQNFYDGFLAGAGGGAARVLAPALGVGANVAYQAGRRAGAEAIANGAVTMVQEYAKTGSIEKAIAAAARSAILAVPGAVIGSGSVKRLLAGSIAAAGTAYAGAIAAGASPNEAFQQASIALASHVAVSTVKHGNAKDAARVRRGQRAGKRVKQAITKAASPKSATQTAAAGSQNESEQSTGVPVHIPTDVEIAGAVPNRVPGDSDGVPEYIPTRGEVDHPTPNAGSGASDAVPQPVDAETAVAGDARPRFIEPEKARRIARPFKAPSEPSPKAAESPKAPEAESQEASEVKSRTEPESEARDAAPETEAGPGGTQRISASDEPGEKIGKFTVYGTTTLEENGTVLHRTIGGLHREGGRQTKKIEIASLLAFTDALILDAKNAGATRLRISGQVVLNPNVLRVDRLARLYGGTARQTGPMTVELDLPLTGRPSKPGHGDGDAVPEHISSDVDARGGRRLEDAREVHAVMPPAVNPQTRTPRTDLPSLPREGRKSPERLFELLGRGFDQRLKPAPAAGEVTNPPRSGDFRRRIKRPRAAYKAYDDALAVSNGREVAIYYNLATREYAVTIGSEVTTALPIDHSPNRSNWVALVHYHPNPHRALVLHLPSPHSDWFDVLDRFYSGEAGLVREYVEWSMPGEGRGRTEFGMDLQNTARPFYIRIVREGKPPFERRFKDQNEYRAWYDSETKYVGQRTPLHDFQMASARQSRAGGEGGSGPGQRTPPTDDTGTRRSTAEPTVLVDPRLPDSTNGRSGEGRTPAPDRIPNESDAGLMHVEDSAVGRRGSRAPVRAGPPAPPVGQSAPRSFGVSGEIDVSAPAHEATTPRPAGAPHTRSRPALKGGAKLFREHLDRDPAALFVAERMNPIHREGVEKYNRGEIGNSVRELDLSGKTAQKIHELLIGRGFTHTSDVLRDFSANANPKGRVQTDPSGTPIAQHFYIHPDGGMVRVKPQGDPASVRKQPQASKSVLYPPTAPASDFDSEACKVTNDGIAVPTRLNDLRNPYPKGTPEHTEFTRAWGDVSHMNL